MGKKQAAKSSGGLEFLEITLTSSEKCAKKDCFNLTINLFYVYFRSRASLLKKKVFRR